MLHLRTWLVWIACLVAVTLSTHNPFYLALILLVVQVVRTRVAQLSGVEAPDWLLRFGLVVIVLSALFNAVSVHFGDTVILYIPGTIPLLSGPVTVEGLVYGATNGLIITVVISVFSVFNVAVPAYQLVRSTPRAFQSIGVTIGIALTFIPQTVRRFKEVREAQAVRGHRVRGTRDWLPLWLPLLIGGLEQSTQLSEAMVARGFGATQDRMASLRTRLLIAVGLGLLLFGWLLRFIWSAATLAGILLMVSGAVLILASLWMSGRSVTHTIYKPQPFTPQDALCAITSILPAVLLLLPVPFISQSTLQYYPYPMIQMPGFDPALGILMLLWLCPAIVAQAEQAQPDNTQA